MLHFVIQPYCPNLDLERTKEDLFGDNQCLFILEKKPAWHVHVHGYPREGCPDITKYLKELAAQHSKRAIDTRCLPIKRKHEGVDEKGFQYVCKFLGTDMDVILNNGFSQEDLEELKKKSDEAREALKVSMSDYIKEHYIPAPGAPFDEVHDAYLSHGLWFYKKEKETLPPPNFKRLVLWALCNHHECYHLAVAKRI